MIDHLGIGVTSLAQSKSFFLKALAPLGVWIVVRIARRIDQKLFYRFIYAGMLLTGLKLVWDALAL